MTQNTLVAFMAILTATAWNGGCVSLVDVAPPGSQTYGAMRVTSVRIRDYWEKQGKVPADPSEMPILQNRDCEMVDDWGRPLHWQSDGESVVRVWSLGRDDKIGGEGEDQDWEFTFDGKQSHQDALTEIKQGDFAP